MTYLESVCRRRRKAEKEAARGSSLSGVVQGVKFAPCHDHCCFMASLWQLFRFQRGVRVLNSCLVMAAGEPRPRGDGYNSCDSKWRTPPSCMAYFPLTPVTVEGI